MFYSIRAKYKYIKTKSFSFTMYIFLASVNFGGKKTVIVYVLCIFEFTVHFEHVQQMQLSIYYI